MVPDCSKCFFNGYCHVDYAEFSMTHLMNKEVELAHKVLNYIKEAK